MSKYKQTFAEAYKNIYESAAAREIDRTNTRKDSMDYQMYKKSAELLRKKDYKALGKHIHKSDTAPREYVMDVISKKEPATFKKIYGNQTGFLATMKPLSMGEELEEASKYLRYSDLLIQKGRMQRAGDKQGERLTDIEIEKEKKKLGIKEDLNQDDEKVIKKVKDMLKGASAKHAAQAKMIDKALKDEAFTKKDFDKNEDENDHTLNAVMLAKEFGSSKEIKDMEDIDKRHRQRGHINEPDYSKRNALVKKYYPRLK